MQDFSTRFYSMATSIVQNHNLWTQQQRLRVAETAPGQFLLKSGPDLFKLSRRVGSRIRELKYTPVKQLRRGPLAAGFRGSGRGLFAGSTLTFLYITPSYAAVRMAGPRHAFPLVACACMCMCACEHELECFCSRVSPLFQAYGC